MSKTLKRLSYINEDEIDDAIKIVEESLGFEMPRVCRFWLAVKIYVRPEEISTFVNDAGETKSLYIPKSATANDKFTNAVGLVIGMGPTAFADKEKFPHGKDCEIGDWIVFPRYDGSNANYKGVPIKFIYDEHCICVVADPTDIQRD